ncbi:MAG TPA: signal peptidase I [Allocoleopsis sp.]
MSDNKNQNSQNQTVQVKEQKQESWVVETTKTVVLSVFLAFGIRTFVAEARYIPSESMVPTLLVNDRLIIDKVSYHFHNPQRGDIVVFDPPPDAPRQSGNEKTAFIKRVIGLPGEKIQLKGGKVYINDKPLKEEYLKRNEQTLECMKTDDYDLAKSVIIPANSYVVLGDNRNNSSDSRCWKFAQRDKIIGQAFVRFWPLPRMGQLNKSPEY